MHGPRSGLGALGRAPARGLAEGPLPHSGDAQLHAPFLVTVATSGAILMSLIARSRSWPVAPAALIGTLVPTLPDLLLGLSPPVAVNMLGVMVGLLVFAGIESAPFKGRRLVASLATGLGAWLALG